MTTRATAIEYSTKGIRVNAVASDVGQTPILYGAPRECLDMLRYQVPQGRLGEPHKVAATVAFLADEKDASHITGQIWCVDDGRSAS
jgi:NAD(P)-dependent dehydrogenase (short-subunit alcohol dehydrogenase family)